MPGHLEVHKGPMFAGKTTKLLRLYNASLELGLKSVVISHALDQRYAKKFVVSHDGVKAPCVAVTNLEEANSKHNVLLGASGGNQIIFIDEAQFMPDLVWFCKTAMEASKTVHVFGLDKDYLLRDFNNMNEVSLLANENHRLRGVCNLCGSAATCTARLAKSTERILIGSSEYEPRCEKCHTTPTATK
jgi:thymidine kinase